MDRLNTASKTGQTIGYTYDANGNRLAQTGTSTATYSISSTNNRVNSITGTPSRTYSYDAAGNVTGDGGLTSSYSDAGRLSSVKNAGATTSYIVNALGQRVKKSSSSATRLFVYDEAGHLIGEYDGSGALVQETVWLGDTPAATLRSNGSGGVNVFYVHTDHLNSSRRISRPSDNAIIWRWDSDPFGMVVANEDPDGDSALFAYNLRFPGQYFDMESGLHYNYFRDYDPVIGRYVESDPIGLDGGLNTYAYVRGNPLSRIDPMGLADFLEKCTGRYANCSVTQDTDASTIGNYLRWKVCEKSVDAACGKGFPFCCDVERQSCYVGAVGNEKEVLVCAKKHAECIKKGN